MASVLEIIADDLAKHNTVLLWESIRFIITRVPRISLCGSSVVFLPVADPMPGVRPSESGQRWDGGFGVVLLVPMCVMCSCNWETAC